VHHHALVFVQGLEHALALEILYGEHSRVERHAHLVEDVRDKLLLAVLGAALHRLRSLQLGVLRAQLLAQQEDLPVRPLAPVHPHADVDVVEDEAHGLSHPRLLPVPAWYEEDHRHDHVDGGHHDAQHTLAPQADHRDGRQAEQQPEHVQEHAIAALVLRRSLAKLVTAPVLMSEWGRCGA
jgi:hypothetical protein